METEADRLRAKHRNELLRTGRAWPTPRGLFYSFQKYLDRLPWGVSQVDERRIEGAVRVNRDDIAAHELAAWLADVRIARRPRVGAYWGIRAGEPRLARQLSPDGLVFVRHRARTG
jgi:hypothetical protein